MSDKIPDREITPELVYLNRRSFMRAGIVGASVLATGFAYRQFIAPSSKPGDEFSALPSTNPATSRVASLESNFSTDEPRTSYSDITNYNNFYEFTTDKESVASASSDFVTRPWKVEVTGLCAKPATFDLDDILKTAPLEERVYRMRCVEGWSMVIPWVGFSLSDFIKKCEPTSKAKFVEFTTLYDPRQMPGVRSPVLRWPYVEGLRMDEAMHPLATLVVGLYGEVLPNQDGAPIRLAVPWKYGFKSIKSIVKINFVEKQPTSSWTMSAPQEYGFYSNVNPTVDHPRWSQASERRIGEFFRRKSLMFNGYAEQVASLYTGLDLRRNY